MEVEGEGEGWCRISVGGWVGDEIVMLFLLNFLLVSFVFVGFGFLFSHGALTVLLHTPYSLAHCTRTPLPLLCCSPSVETITF